jgi:hypothetical protein
MDWQKVERELSRAFRARPERVGEALVVHRRRPVALAPLMESTLTEDERDEYGDLAVSPGSVSELLTEAGAEEELLRFYWESFGPPSWEAGMVLVGTGRRRYVGVWDEVDSHRVFAAVEPWDDPRAVSSAVSAYLAVNGRRHGDGLFGSLPTEVSNDCPELLPTPVVKQALFDYMQWAESVDPGTWALFASEHYGRMVEPDHLTRSLDVLRTMPPLDRIDEELEALERESEGLSLEARQRLFDEWFETAYAVRGGVGPSRR